MRSSRVVKTFITEDGRTLYQWGLAAWGLFMPPDVLHLTLDSGVPVSQWHKGPAPMPELAALTPTLMQISALAFLLIDTRPIPLWEDTEVSLWNYRVLCASTPDRHYCHLPVCAESAGSDLEYVLSLVAAGRTPVLFANRQMDIAPFINMIAASGLTIKQHDWQPAPIKPQGGK